MATTSNFGSDNKNLNKNSDISSSVYHKTVCLQDWWLIKAEKDFNGRRLAIGGLAAREQRAVRVFSSSPIIKRYDLFTLETADGITVLISGSINKSRTEENGFTSEVCSHFVIGFPYYWETYADQCFGKESTTRGGQKHEHEEKGLLHATNKKTKEIPNKQEKLTPIPESEEQKKFCFQVKPENATHGTPTMHVNTEIVNSSDFEPLPTKETSIDNGIGGTGPPFNPSKRITRNCSAEDHTDPTGFDAEVVLPAMIDKSVPVKNSIDVKLSKGFKKSKNGPDKVKADGVLKSEIINFCPSVSQGYEADMVVHVEAISRGGVKLSLSSDTEGMDKCVSPLNDSLPKRISKLTRQDDNNVKDGALLIQSIHLVGENNDASKDLPLPMVSSDVNNATPLNMVVPLNLKTLSKRLGRSKSSKKNNSKTKTSLMSEESATLRSCTDGTDTNDSTRDVSPSIQTDLTNVYPCVVKMTASVDISSDNLTRIPKTQEKAEEETSGSSTRKKTNLHSISRSDYEVVIGIPVEETLGQGNSFDIGVVDGIEGTLEQSSSTKPDVVSPKISERGENSENRPCIESKNNEPISTLEALQKPSGHHLIGNCVSSVNIPSCRKLDSSEEIVNPSEARRSSIRVKNLRSRYKEDKTSNNRTGSERNKTVSVSKGCDMKSNVDDVDSGLGRICDLDQLNIGLGETAPGLTKADVDDKSSRNVSQMNCMLSSVSRLSTGALRNLSCGSAYDSPEASKENETCRTPMRLDDTKCTSDLKMSPGQEQSTNKKQKKLGRKKRNAVPLPPVTRSTKEDLSFVSPESLSLRRSRSGRLLVPPLDFWRNQHPVYGVDRRITGVFTGDQDGPSHLGSSSEVETFMQGYHQDSRTPSIQQQEVGRSLLKGKGSSYEFGSHFPMHHCGSNSNLKKVSAKGLSSRMCEGVQSLEPFKPFLSLFTVFIFSQIPNVTNPCPCFSTSSPLVARPRCNPCLNDSMKSLRKKKIVM